MSESRIKRKSLCEKVHFRILKKENYYRSYIFKYNLKYIYALKESVKTECNVL